MKDRIRLIMEDQHLTQKSFSQLTGIGEASLSSIFNDRTKPTLNHIDAIHKKFPQVRLEWLLYGTPPMYIENENQNDASSTPSSSSLDSSPAIGGLAFDFDDDASLSAAEASSRASSSNESSAASSQMHQGSLFDQPNMPGVSSTPKNQPHENVKYVDKPQRKITEIRIFYDDQTWETFVPKK